MNKALAFAGPHGPLLLFFGVLTGFLFPKQAGGAPVRAGLCQAGQAFSRPDLLLGPRSSELRPSHWPLQMQD